MTPHEPAFSYVSPPERLVSEARQTEIYDWLMQGVGTLPGMEVTRRNLTSPPNWIAHRPRFTGVMDAFSQTMHFLFRREIQVTEVEGRGQQLGGIHVGKVGVLDWDQGATFPNTKVVLNTTTGEQVPVLGAVIALMDATTGNVLLYQGNEPGMPQQVIDGQEKHPATLGPQGSFVKFDDLQAGSRNYDPQVWDLNELLHSATGETMLTQIHGKPAIIIYSDTNKIMEGPIIFSCIALSDRGLLEQMRQVTGGMFFSLGEITQVLMTQAIAPLNGHAAVIPSAMMALYPQRYQVSYQAPENLH